LSSENAFAYKRDDSEFKSRERQICQTFLEHISKQLRRQVAMPKYARKIVTSNWVFRSAPNLKVY